MKLLYRVALCGAIGVGTLAFGGGDTQKGGKTPVPQLASIRAEEREAVLNQLSKERSDLEAGLILQLDASKPKEVIFSVAYLLGLHRMENSARHLARFIALEADASMTSREPLWGRYPVVNALIRIGKPAAPTMIETIEASGDEKVRELSTDVIRHVEGKQFGLLILQKALADASDDRNRAKLKASIKYMESLPE